VDRSREILVVELGSGDAAAALLERAARRPDSIHPFQLRAGVGVSTSLPPAPSSSSSSSTAAAAAAAVAAAGAGAGAAGGLARLPPPPSSSLGGEGGQGDASSRWGHSVLAGRLKSRTAPLPPLAAVATTGRPTLAAMIERQQKNQPKVAKARRGGGSGVNGKLAAAEEELRPGQVVRSNRWTGLLSDSEGEEEEEEKKGAPKAAAGAAAAEGAAKDGKAEQEGKGEGDGRAAAAPAPAPVPAAPSPPPSEEDEEEAEEEDEEEAEEDEMEMEVTCQACTYVYFSGDYCPICSHPRK
jgi:hypothetical protein